MSFKTTLRSAGVGRLAYHLWYQPRRIVKNVIRAGGPHEVLRTELGRREMEASARTLPPLPPPPANAPTVHLLTGAKLWYQTVFFLNTLNRYIRVRPVIHDDGSFNKNNVAWLKQALPSATIISNAESEARLDQFLPAARYPCLRERRQRLVLFRKILDVHAGATGWRIFFDSDMLVFRKPDMLANWLLAPKNCLHMTDVSRAYGYELTVLEKLAGAPVPDLVNTGILGLQSDLIDWDRMEWWCRTLIERHGPHYYQEQALMAMHLATQNYAALPGKDYVVLPGETEAGACGAVMHHYVADSKKWYFRHCWRVALDQSARTPVNQVADESSGPFCGPIIPDSSVSFKNRLRSAGLGRLVYRVWHEPKDRFRTMIAAGGPLEVRRTELGRREMEAAARNLPALSVAGNAPVLQLHLLTGKRFWYQTAFCLWSFARQSGRQLMPVIYDDGTLAAEQCAPLAQLFPGTRFVSHAEIVSRLDARLPAASFPTLRERWHVYPNIRKLTDVHVGEAGWKLVLDSDLLFFHRPQFVLDWLDHPVKPLHAVDCETSYGYPRTVMNEMAGAPVADLVNVGLTGLDGSTLDWERLEWWGRTLIERHGPHYYLEQALIAMLVAGRDCAIAPAVDYITKPGEEEGRRCRAVMHHYVADSKKSYFRHCWRTVLNQ